MAMALADLSSPIRLIRQRALLQLAFPCAQSHRTAQFFHATQLTQLINYAVRCGRIELARVRLLEAANIARELDARGLHAQANSKVRNHILAGVLNALQHAFDT